MAATHPGAAAVAILAVALAEAATRPPRQVTSAVVEAVDTLAVEATPVAEATQAAAIAGTIDSSLAACLILFLPVMIYVSTFDEPRFRSRLAHRSCAQFRKRALEALSLEEQAELLATYRDGLRQRGTARAIG